MFDCKKEVCQRLLDSVSPIQSALCGECTEHFEAVTRYLTRLSVDFTLDTKLARGLDYYTKTIFEIEHPKLGAQNVLAGGGRYDGLVEELGGDPTPASGVSSGVGRLLLAMESENIFEQPTRGVTIYVAALGEGAALAGAGIVADLRSTSSVETDYQGRSLKAQMRDASRLGAQYVVILGDDELARSVAIVREMDTGNQEELPLDGVAAYVRGRLQAM
jgi:histidyl-tRNA synthetase